MTPLVGRVTLIDVAVVAGIALVLPAAFGERWRGWLVAAASALASCAVRGATPAAVALSLPWLLVMGSVAVRQARRSMPTLRSPATRDVRLLASLYGCLAASWFVLSRAGITPMGIQEPIVELTAVHFTYVGAGALKLAVAAAELATGPRWTRAGQAGLLLTGGAPPLVALGFVTGTAVLQVGGAVLLTIGVWTVAALELSRAFRARGGRVPRTLLAVSGLAIWAPMVLAVAWAAGQHWAVPCLSVPDMVRTHGAVNALAFIGAGLLALRLEPDTGVRTWR